MSDDIVRREAVVLNILGVDSAMELTVFENEAIILKLRSWHRDEGPSHAMISLTPAQAQAIAKLLNEAASGSE